MKQVRNSSVAPAKLVVRTAEIRKRCDSRHVDISPIHESTRPRLSFFDKAARLQTRAILPKQLPLSAPSSFLLSIRKVFLIPIRYTLSIENKQDIFMKKMKDLAVQNEVTAQKGSSRCKHRSGPV